MATQEPNNNNNNNNNNNSTDSYTNNYFYTINNYMTLMNNSIYYLNRSNEIISNMQYNLDYYYYNNVNVDRNYIPLDNDRRRRRLFQQYTGEENHNDTGETEQILDVETSEETREETSEEITEETREEIEERLNNMYTEFSRENLINAISSNIIKVKYGDICNPVDSICTITQEEFEPDDDVGFINNCGHIFNYDSLLTWLIRHQTCPNCRYSVLSNTNLIRYTDTDSNERLYLTNSQFRRHVIGRVLGNFFNNENVDNSRNTLSINYI